jgi:GT2 family glycosyltransferase
MVQSNPSVAIVILNYNGQHHLQQFLPSVIASTYQNKKVIVADNASNDDSLTWLQQNHPSVEIIRLKENYGFARGYNEALKQVEATYYVLLNSDVEVSKGWIESVINLMEVDTNVAACQPKIRSQLQPTMFEYAGACGGWMDSLGYPFSRGRVFDVCEEDKGQYDSVQQIFWCSGAAMFVRASIYHEMGGLDPYFFAHQEEIDLCWRMQLSGYSLLACPQSVVYHVGGGTLPKGKRKAYLNFRNNLVMVTKNWTWQEKWWKLPLRILLDLVTACKSLISGDTDFFAGILQAHFAYYRWLFSGKKQNLYSQRRSPKLHGLYSGSVVWQYFARKKKTFAEIVSQGN